MANRSSFFDSPKEWSKRKHRLLGKYLVPFSAKLGSTSRRIYCVDAFAGKAKYEDDSPGSPLIMARLSDKCAAWSKPVELQLINVEADPENFASLEEVTNPWVLRGVVKNIPEEFGDVVSDILADVGNAPAFFFIDPYGPTDILFSYLQPILARPQRKTELMINFAHHGLRRLTDQLHSRAKTPSGVKAAQTMLERAGKIVGGDRWKKIFTSRDLSIEEQEEVLLTEYIENLGSFDYSVAAYPVREKFGKPAKYYLIFCTRHPDGIALMNDFIREEEKTMLIESRGGQRLLSLFEDAEQTERHRALKDLVLTYVQVVKKTTREQIMRHCIPRSYGMYHSKEYKAIIDELRNEGLFHKPSAGKIKDHDLLIYATEKEGKSP